jgi:hypothetical protein
MAEHHDYRGDSAQSFQRHQFAGLLFSHHPDPLAAGCVKNTAELYETLR